MTCDSNGHIVGCIVPGVALHVVNHPVALDALTVLRDATTLPHRFRGLAHRVGVVLAMEATRDLPTVPRDVTTPLEVTTGARVGVPVVVVAVLRAGLSLVDAVLDLVPTARVGHIGLRRDEATAEAHEYSKQLPPDLGASLVLLVDPMLATGGSAIMAVDRLKAAGATRIRLLCVVAAPEGVAALAAAHPDVDVYTPVVDRELNDQKYILPGLGDFGDRLYGTV
ncbi:MAG: uracil phosphoribosyltransferase [Acidobacteria bacterium]|jgi:uracil phosphoribosyltransferase|nr:uracil phosphoribosyltransferase [Acidobacteriota bacterium]